ncbi:right-handed parallel beta-helix repeat-containing protein [Kitasatospora sp. NPDC096140]|uniref:right-handed parallel beta-helix repeat-containing protein n=1 Tax=Kitasatospora sp. NPDC096140 TaxID=3155425 RepID=UPI00332B0A94
MESLRTRITALLGGLLVVLAAGVLLPGTAHATSRVRTVPTDYPTIQAAVDAAQPGDEIRVRPGTYREQLFVGKDLRISGAGADTTRILAPAVLAPGEDGGTSIVEIHGGARVAMSRLAVSGPGSGTCASGALGSGIRVLSGGHLDLNNAAVSHITDTPAAPCPHSAVGIFVGDFPTGTGSATIRNSRISDYQGSGVTVLNAGSSVSVLESEVTGHPTISTDGIGFVLGATGTVARSTITDNACRPSDSQCGPDFFSQTQHAGIVAGAPGTVITGNSVNRNQVGIYAVGSADLSRNSLTDNDYFGMALQDGTFTVRQHRIEGGVGGVAVIAATADTTATLDRVSIRRTSGAPVQIFECCGFTATATTRR